MQVAIIVILSVTVVLNTFNAVLSFRRYRQR